MWGSRLGLLAGEECVSRCVKHEQCFGDLTGMAFVVL